MASKPRQLTIRELLDVVKTNISDIPRCTIAGVVSEASLSRGNMYFTLTDGNCAMSCIVWQHNTAAIQCIKLGTNLSCTGRVDFYAARGKVSVVVTGVVVAAVASDNVIDPTEETRKRLLEQRLCVGMTESNQPRSLPARLDKIAVLTAVASAAWQDLRCTLRESGLDQLLVPYDCLVQGDEAPAKIAAKIAEIGEHHDVLCIVRGGGSGSDLAAFSHELVVHACIDFRNRSPSHLIICGVGHEIDHPLVELVSDIVRRTPTMVANTISEHAATEANKRRTKLESIHRELETHYNRAIMRLQTLLCCANQIRAERASIVQIHQTIMSDLEKRMRTLVELRQQAESITAQETSRREAEESRREAEQSRLAAEEMRRSNCVLLDSKLVPFDFEHLPTNYTHAILAIGDRRIKIKFKAV